METNNEGGYIYKKAIILGNGFDIANGFPTRYSDFISSIQFAELLNSNNQLASYIRQKYDEASWVDIEEQIGIYSAQLEKYTRSQDFGDATRIFKKEYEELTRALFDYIDSIRSGQVNSKMEKLVVDWKNTLCGKEKEKVLFVSFNYLLWDITIMQKHMTSERFVGKFPQFPHGIISNEKPNIVLGVDSNSVHSKKHPFIVKSFNKNCKSEIFFRNIQKAKHYIIFGCSMGNTDQRYFKPIFSDAKNKKFEIYDYDDDSLSTIKSNISRLCNYDLFIQNNDVTFNTAIQFSSSATRIPLHQKT